MVMAAIIVPVYLDNRTHCLPYLGQSLPKTIKKTKNQNNNNKKPLLFYSLIAV